MYFSQAIEKVAELEMAHLNRGNTYYLIENYELAKEDFLYIMENSHDLSILSSAREMLTKLGVDYE